jgi:hypothetical protein
MGRAIVFHRDGSGWHEQQTLAGPELGRTYGWSVALAGETAVIGAPSSALLSTTPRGQVYVYTKSGGSFGLTKTLQADVPRNSDYFGSSVALAGETLLIGASGDESGASGLPANPGLGRLSQSGAAYLYGRHGAEWVRSTYFKASNATAGAAFAQQAILAGDRIVVNAPNESTTAVGSGAVYVFR